MNRLGRGVLVVTGVVLGMAVVAGSGLWQARQARAQAFPGASSSLGTRLHTPLPAASVPSGSYTAPGDQG